MNKCIECIISPPIQVVHKHMISYNGKTALTGLSGPFNNELTDYRRCGITVISSQQLIPCFRVKAFPDASSVSLAAVAKPADPMVLLQTGAVMIFAYLIANFVVPQLLSKSMGFNEVDENEKSSK